MWQNQRGGHIRVQSTWRGDKLGRKSRWEKPGGKLRQQKMERERTDEVLECNINVLNKDWALKRIQDAADVPVLDEEHHKDAGRLRQGRELRWKQPCSTAYGTSREKCARLRSKDTSWRPSVFSLLRPYSSLALLFQEWYSKLSKENAVSLSRHKRPKTFYQHGTLQEARFALIDLNIPGSPQDQRIPGPHP